jgi:hypothetical protein
MKFSDLEICYVQPIFNAAKEFVGINGLARSINHWNAR